MNFKKESLTALLRAHALAASYLQSYADQGNNPYAVSVSPIALANVVTEKNDIEQELLARSKENSDLREVIHWIISI